MSLIETNLFEAVKRQYIFKLKAYFEFIFSLIIFQAIAICFIYFGISSESTSSMDNINIISYSSSIFTVFTIIVLFSVAIVIQTEKYNKIGAVTVGNRLSSNLSNIGYLVTLCIFGAVTSLLDSVFLKVMIYFTNNNILNEGFYASPYILFINILSIILYAVLVSSIGYLAGAFVRLHKIFIIILPAFLIGMLFAAADSRNSEFISIIYKFYCGETSLFIFAAKSIITSAIFLSAAVAITNNLETK